MKHDVSSMAGMNGDRLASMAGWQQTLSSILSDATITTLSIRSVHRYRSNLPIKVDIELSAPLCPR
jgi:hypothetical protein